MRILFSLDNFNALTGSELYVYELTRELEKRGHETMVAAPYGGEIAQHAAENGVELWTPDDVPLPFDIMHLSQPGPTRYMLDRFPDKPAVVTVHGVLPGETPVIDDRIGRYICILPEVRQKCFAEDGIPYERLELTYNPIDRARFKPRKNGHEHEAILVAGAVNELRREMGEDVIRYAIRRGWQAQFYGGSYPGGLMSVAGNVRYNDETWHIEDAIHQAGMVAGLWLGRSIIEGWACGKPALCYHFDRFGHITAIAEREPPPDLEKFDSGLVAEQIIKVYEQVLGG